jgi:protease II
MLHWPVSVLAGLYLLLSNTSSTVRAFTVGQRARSSLERKLPLTSSLTSQLFRPKMTPSNASCHSKDFPPPIAHRDLDRVVLAGKLPDNPHNSSYPKSLIRQAESSVEKLLDPPRSVSDPYGWLRDDDRTNTEVLEHLRKENEYTTQITRHLEPLRNKLYSELLSSIQETDYTTPNMKDNSWYYYTRTFEGDSYTVYCRAPYNLNSDPIGQGEMHTWDGTREMQVLKDEEIYLNVNELAKGHDYCSVSSVTTASKSSHNLFAYAVDFTGDEIYEIVVRDFNTGEIVDKVDHVDCYGSVLFGSGEHEIFYITVDEAQRPYQVWRRRIGEG